MVYLFTALKQHFRKDFDWVSALLVFLFAGIFVVMQYRFHLIRYQIITFPHAQRIPLYLLFFGVVYLGSCFILYARKQIPNVFTNKAFWLTVFLVLLINAVDQSYFLLSLVKDVAYSSDALRSAVISVATFSVSFFSVIIPSYLLYRFYDRDQESFYGLSLGKGASVKPYFQVLFIALVLVSISTLSSGMSSYYPVYRRMGIYNHAEELGLSPALAISAFETVYASNFIAVELFFRGVFVFIFVRFLGKQAILPMAACYMVFHFGKPLLETLSSFFGGYMLGVFALYSRNIWGGIILHIGTALFMELIAGLI